jgi:Ni,Fe-hydrogenase III large subunit/Ni,Fe-hydrogenase III component G
MTTMTPFPDMDIAWTPMPGVLPAMHAAVGSTQLHELCRQVREHGGHLVSLWAEDRRDTHAAYHLCVVLEMDNTLLVLEHPMPSEMPSYPDLSSIFPSASRLQRAAHDLVGIHAVGGDGRPWLRHTSWSADTFPLRAGTVTEPMPDESEPYPFVHVEGDGVHEIAVGPVHAGTIEPGHFRFSVVGEKVLRLEERLGYTHKGIEKRFEGMTLMEGVRLAARVSGDSTVAYAWAYAMAAEAVTHTVVPPRAIVLRALLLERERLANHLGDVGALGNDAGLALGLSQFSRLKEDLLRVNVPIWAARYPMDVITPGGVRNDLTPVDMQRLLESMAPLENELHELRDIYDNHAGLQDRFMGAGCVAPSLAEQLGVVGLVARASGQAQDWRASLRMPPYDESLVTPITREQGDVAARVAVRFDEVLDSLRLCRHFLTVLPTGPISVPLGEVQSDELVVGGVEGWRGPVLVGLRASLAGKIIRCHPHDPSWHNWPALEHAIINNIVPDFPLINKSFNLSYSGHDL